MLKFSEESKEVLYNKSNLLTLRKKDFRFLSKIAKRNKKKIVRLCVHKSKKEIIHQMFIIHPKKYFVPPHQHNREESMLVLKGRVDVIFLNKFGKIKKIIKMGEFKSGKTFYYQLPKNTLHTLKIKSKELFFLEITRGPFKKKNMKKVNLKNWQNQSR